MFSTDNASVQSSLQAAVEYLAALPAHKDEVVQSKRTLVKEYLSIVKVYSASSNNIPGLRGVGLEQALEIAAGVLAGEYDNSARIDFKNVGLSLLV